MFFFKVMAYVVLALFLTSAGVSVVSNTAQYVGIMFVVMVIDMCSAFESRA